MASLFLGLGLTPQSLDPYINLVDLKLVRTHLTRVREAIQRTVQAQPDHGEFLARWGRPDGA